MGLFKKKAPEPQSVSVWGDPDAYCNEEVTGESFHQEELAGLGRYLQAHGVRDGRFVATLVREPTNKFDSNAVSVQPVLDGAIGVVVGYLPRGRAAQLAGAIDKLGGTVACYGKLIGGRNNDGTERNWGVVLDFGDDWRD